VSVVKTKGTIDYSTDEETTYRFYNYDSEWSSGIGSDGQRSFYPPVGHLLSTVNSQERVDYEYNDPESLIDTIRHEYVEYLPFKYGPDIYNYQSRTSFLTFWQTQKPKKIIKTKYATEGSGSVTTLDHNYETGNVESETTQDMLGGNVYTVEYKYWSNSRGDALHDDNRDVKVPYETITRKNGKVTSAEVVLFEQTVHPLIRPWKRYVLDTETPIDDYQSPSYCGATDIDPRCKLVETFQYTSDGDLYCYRPVGQEPVYFEWDPHGRLLSKRAGIMKTTYTYNLYGVTSETGANGAGRFTEYDALGRPTVVRDEAGIILKTFKYESGLNP
jgi:hypothetical protein